MMWAFVGTLSRPMPYVAAANGPGLAVLTFDETTGALDLRHEIGGIDNPSYLTLAPDGRTLYATSEVFGWHEGIATAYRIDRATGALRYINRQPTQGSIAAFAGFDRSGQWLLVANYRMGEDGLRPPQAAVVFPIAADGGLGPVVAAVAHAGRGPNADRQEGPHPHCALASPDNRHVLVADLGIDRIMVYRFDAATGALHPAAHPWATLPPGSGPRHLTFDPAGRFLYAINELASTIAVFAWDAAGGGLAPVQTIGALPSAWQGESHCSDVQISPDGRFLYGANRGHDSIAVFAIDPADGRLTLIGHHPTLGRTPRQFTIDPSGRFLLIANQNADAVVVLARDARTGLLSDTGQRAGVGTPMCVKLLPA
jgi:6-phosphogluconolactonase